MSVKETIMKEYYSHKRENGDLQTIKEHLYGTAELASIFASKFGAPEQGRLCGLAHDIGKYSDQFQKRLLENGPKVDHSTAGTWECAKLNQMYAAFCVAGHHGGLPDLGTRDDLVEGTLYGKLNRAMQNRLPSYSAWSSEIILPKIADFFTDTPNPLDINFYIRMLYSCLVDADYLNTEAFMKDGDIDRGSAASIPELLMKCENYIKEAGWLEPTGELNEKRSRILKSCMQEGTLRRGIFTLSVPTGGGKTISSLAFALGHAVEHKLERIIYVIPYTSIIEQTADVFRRILGNENVLEHHSGVEYDPDECVDKKEIRMSLASENWDIPVVVTTAVQFFESLFASRSSKCRKLHNIAKSVIVFDEAQMMPLSYLRPCIYAISQLVSRYNCSSVLCTATQPALEGFFKEFYGQFEAIELCPKGMMEDPVFQRVLFRTGETLSWADVADRMNAEYQILCIVNSRANAKNVYQRLRSDGCYHLSTLMIPRDRRKKLDEIRERLKQGLPCRVVSTSLIEAGVDVDFPKVLREEAGIDSLIQAAGRCNREGKRPLEESIVTVFNSETKAPALFQTGIDVGRYIMKRYDDISNPEAIHAYFEELFSVRGNSSFDKKEIIRKSQGITYPFKTIAEEFHLIDDITRPVYIPIGEGKRLVDRKMNGETSRKLERELNQYTVNIYERHFRSLYEAGDIMAMEDGSWYLTNTNLYNENTGLSTEADYGKAEFI